MLTALALALVHLSDVHSTLVLVEAAASQTEHTNGVHIVCTSYTVHTALPEIIQKFFYCDALRPSIKCLGSGGQLLNRKEMSGNLLEMAKVYSARQFVKEALP